MTEPRTIPIADNDVPYDWTQRESPPGQSDPLPPPISQSEDPWGQFEDVSFGNADDWSMFEDVAETGAPPMQQPQQAPPGFMQRGKSAAVDAFHSLKNISVGEGLLGLGEAALTIGTGVVGTAAGGIAGLNAASTQVADPADPSRAREDYETGRPTFQSRPDPVEAVHSTQEAMTYQPRTEAGEAILDAIAWPFEEYERAAYDIAYGAGAPEHTTGATGAYTALMMLPAAFGMKARRMKQKRKGEEAPSIETLRDEAHSLYKKAEDAGVSVTSESFRGVMKQIETELTKAGFDKNLHPDTYAALKNLWEKVENHQTLQGVEINRRIISAARGALKPDDARMASIMMEAYDDWMGVLGKRGRKDLLFGDAAKGAEAVAMVREARGLWSRALKSDEIEWLITRAQTRAGQFSGSGFENALRTEFRQLAMNRKRMKRFSAEEQAAIRLVAEGGKFENALRALGRFAGRGPVSAALTGGIGYTALGVPGAIGTLAAGEAGRRGATAMTIQNAKRASETMRRSPERR